jgi:hypothetical protein
MKKVAFILCFILSWKTQANETILTDVPAHVFVNNGKTNFDSLFLNMDIEPIVKKLFEQGELFHDYTLEVHPTSNFQTYWSVFKSRWKAIDMNNDGVAELIMAGRTSSMDQKEYVEIYTLEDSKYKRKFAEVGKLLAYKIQPNTKEIVLFHHRYPCCYSASHNIFTIRFLRGEIHLKDRYFVGRDTGDMVGPFFPESVDYPLENQQLENSSVLYWSPAIVEKKAFENYSEENILAYYTAGSIYKVLHTQGDWLYVLFFSGIDNKATAVMNPQNFINRPVYGWLKREG